MLSAFKITPEGLKEASVLEKGIWVNVFNPTSDEKEKLTRDLRVPSDILADALDINEIARSEVEDGFVLIVLRIPRFDQENHSDIPFYTMPLGIILSPDAVITVCLEEAEVVQDFVSGKVKGFFPENRCRFMLQIFLRAALLYLKYLTEIDRRTDAIAKDLQRSMKNEELIKLMDLEESLVYFTTSLRSNELMIARLQQKDIVEFCPQDKDLLEDVVVEYRQAIEMANVHSDILSGMMDAFGSVIQNNLNIMIKFLTVVTIILTLPMLLGTLYGMNISLPGQDHPYAFLGIVGLSLLLSLVGIWIAIKSRWL